MKNEDDQLHNTHCGDICEFITANKMQCNIIHSVDWRLSLSHAQTIIYLFIYTCITIASYNNIIIYAQIKVTIPEELLQ